MRSHSGVISNGAACVVFVVHRICVCMPMVVCVCVSVHVYKCVIRYRVLTTMCDMYLQGCRIREIGGGQAAGERGELITRHVHTCM